MFALEVDNLFERIPHFLPEAAVIEYIMKGRYAGVFDSIENFTFDNRTYCIRTIPGLFSLRRNLSLHPKRNIPLGFLLSTHFTGFFFLHPAT